MVRSRFICSNTWLQIANAVVGRGLINRFGAPGATGPSIARMIGSDQSLDGNLICNAATDRRSTVLPKRKVATAASKRRRLWPDSTISSARLFQAAILVNRLCLLSLACWLRALSLEEAARRRLRAKRLNRRRTKELVACSEAWADYWTGYKRVVSPMRPVLGSVPARTSQSRQGNSARRLALTSSRCSLGGQASPRKSLRNSSRRFCR